MAEILARHPIFPISDVQMIATGEETGNLAGMFDKLIETYQSELFYGTKGLISGMRPVLILIVGLIVAGYLFQGYSFIQQIFRYIFQVFR